MKLFAMDNRIIHTSTTGITKQSWKALMKCPNASYFQSPEANDFNRAVGWESFTYALEYNDELVVLIQGSIQKEEGLKSSLTKRAIIYGGPLISEKASKKDLKILLMTMAQQLKAKVIYIEIRNLSSYEAVKDVFEEIGFVYNKHLNFRVDCRQWSTYKQRISKSKLRQIKKSLSSGATIVEATSLPQIAAFYAILSNLYKTKVKTPLPKFNFFEKLFEQKEVKFLLIEYENAIIGGIVCPILENRVIYEWFVCGLDNTFKNVYPSILSTWAAIAYASAHNIDFFDFMGAGKPEENYGVRDFKSKFGGDLVEEGRFLMVSKPVLYAIGKKAVSLLKKNA